MHWWNGDGHMAGWASGGSSASRSSRSSSGRSSGLNGSSKSPEQVLKRRYAKGEIDHATYQRMSTELKG